MSLTVFAPAKLNLSLDVCGILPNGYHELRSVMQAIDWCDKLTVDFAPDTDIHLTCDGGIPADERNLAYRAAVLFRELTGRREGYVIDVNKSIPAEAGMGGGSSDGAAVLRALNELTGAGVPLGDLLTAAAALGADVPFFLLGGTALATGTGTDLTPLSPLPDCRFVVVKPEGGVSTPEAYRRLDGAPALLHPDVDGMVAALEAGDLGGVARRVGNSFEVPMALPHTDPITAAMRAHGALAAALTGSGSAVFGLFDSEVAATACADALRQAYPLTRTCKPI